MCGRMSRIFTEKDAEKQKKFMITKIMREFGPSYNVAPTQEVPVIIPGSRILDLYKWGLIPFWAKDKKIGSKLINARSESLEEKPSFREAFKKRRCLVLASGFYEWDSGKKPHHIQVKNEKILAFAGLWDEWKDKESGEKIKSCTIITCEPNSFMKKIHKRMPVILMEEDYSAWLSDKSGFDDLKHLLKGIDSSDMEEFEVSKEVNNVRNNSAELVIPVGNSQGKLF
jgi:putative SOS response-associated peptidase YedK